MRRLRVDPLIDGLRRNGRKFRSLAFKPACNDFRGPPLEEMLLNFETENAAFKAHSFMARSPTIQGLLLGLVWEIFAWAEAGPVSAPFAYQRAMVASNLLADGAPRESTISKHGNVITFVLGYVGVGFHIRLLYSGSQTSSWCTYTLHSWIVQLICDNGMLK